MTIGKQTGNLHALTPHAKVNQDKPSAAHEEAKPLPDGTRFPHVSIDPSLRTTAQPSHSNDAAFQAPMSEAVSRWGQVFTQMTPLSLSTRHLLSLPAQHAPSTSQPIPAMPAAESVLTPVEAQALSSLQNTLAAAGTKGLSLAGIHAIEKLFLKSPEILTALAKTYPFIRTATGLVPHPVVRTLGLVLPWTMEPVLTQWLRDQVGYKDPDPEGKHSPPDLAPVSTLVNWNVLQPMISQMTQGRSEAVQAVAAFTGTFAINALREFVTHLAVEWNKAHATSPTPPSSSAVAKPTAMEKTQAGLLSTGIRGPLELARQLQRINTESFTGSANLNKFLTNYWPGLIPAAMVYLQAELGKGLARYHANTTPKAQTPPTASRD